MRSVLLHLQQATEGEVAAFLSEVYPSRRGAQWIATIEDNPCLYIELYGDAARELDVDGRAALVHRLGGEPAVSVVCDVSGRHPGDEQVRQFALSVLGRFVGVAQDDHSPHLWSLDEIRSGHHADGHPFFDYRGWAEERRRP